MSWCVSFCGVFKSYCFCNDFWPIVSPGTGFIVSRRTRLHDQTGLSGCACCGLLAGRGVWGDSFVRLALLVARLSLFLSALLVGLWVCVFTCVLDCLCFGSLEILHALLLPVGPSAWLFTSGRSVRPSVRLSGSPFFCVWLVGLVRCCVRTVVGAWAGGMF